MEDNTLLKSIETYCKKDSNEICPFSSQKCTKINRAEIGICSFEHKGIKEVICPNLFFKCKFLDFISNSVLKTPSYYCFKEVKVGSNFLDYLLIDKYNKTNYCAVELQALDTTGNYKWVFGVKTKPFCINWKTTKKTIISQIMEKQAILQKAGKAIVLVLQDSLFDYIGFKKQVFDDNKLIHVLPIKYGGGVFDFLNICSYDLSDIEQIMSSDEEIDLEIVINRLLQLN